MSAPKDLYLIAYYSAQPRDPRKTKIKGYMSDPANITYSERVEFSNGLKTRDRSSAGVIINLTKQCIDKNTFNPTAQFEDVVKYYCEAYPDYMRQVGYVLEEPKNESTDVQTVPSQEEEGSKP
jgi:hypothetical protein